MRRLVQRPVFEQVDGHVRGEVVDAVERLVQGQRVRLGRRDADEQGAGQPRAGRRPRCRRGRSVRTPALARARSMVGTMADRWARLATSGTTPPKRACSSTLLAMASASSVVPRTMPTPVSSHDVSMPSTSGSSRWRPVAMLRGHGASPTRRRGRGRSSPGACPTRTNPSLEYSSMAAALSVRTSRKHSRTCRRRASVEQGRDQLPRDAAAPRLRHDTDREHVGDVADDHDRRPSPAAGARRPRPRRSSGGGRRTARRGRRRASRPRRRTCPSRRAAAGRRARASSSPGSRQPRLTGLLTAAATASGRRR